MSRETKAPELLRKGIQHCEQVIATSQSIVNNPTLSSEHPRAFELMGWAKVHLRGLKLSLSLIEAKKPDLNLVAPE